MGSSATPSRFSLLRLDARAAGSQPAPLLSSTTPPQREEHAAAAAATAAAVAATNPPDNRTAGAAAPVSSASSALAVTVGADETSGRGDAPPASDVEAGDGAVVVTPREPSEAVGESVWSGDRGHFGGSMKM